MLTHEELVPTTGTKPVGPRGQPGLGGADTGVVVVVLVIGAESLAIVIVKGIPVTVQCCIV